MTGNALNCHGWRTDSLHDVSQISPHFLRNLFAVLNKLSNIKKKTWFKTMMGDCDKTKVKFRHGVVILVTFYRNYVR